MGNYSCNPEVEDCSWKDKLETECVQMRQSVSWAEALINRLRKINTRSNDEIMRDLSIMNQKFKQNQKGLQMENRSQSENHVVKRKNHKKVLGRTGLTEEDIMEYMQEKCLAQSITQSECSSTPSCLYQAKHTSSNGGLECPLALDQQIDYYSQLTDLIKEHIESPNELGVLVREFQKVYPPNNRGNHFNKCLYEFQQFGFLLYSGIVEYYNLASLKQEQEEIAKLINQDTILSFVTNLLMQHKETYNVLFESCQQFLEAKVQRTRQQLQRLSDINSSQIIPEQQFQLQESANPYIKAISTLRKLQIKQGASSKAKVIVKFSKLIMNEIRDCHNQRGASLMLQGDDLIPILQFILIKAQIVEIDVHLMLTEKLLSTQTLNSTCGYYLISLQAAIDSLESLQI